MNRERSLDREKRETNHGAHRSVLLGDKSISETRSFLCTRLIIHLRSLIQVKGPRFIHYPKATRRLSSREIDLELIDYHGVGVSRTNKHVHRLPGYKWARQYGGYTHSSRRNTGTKNNDNDGRSNDKSNIVIQLLRIASLTASTHSLNLGIEHKSID